MKGACGDRVRRSFRRPAQESFGLHARRRARTNQLIREEPGENGVEASVAPALEIEDELRAVGRRSARAGLRDRSPAVGEVDHELAKDGFVQGDQECLVRQRVEECGGRGLGPVLRTLRPESDAKDGGPALAASVACCRCCSSSC